MRMKDGTTQLVEATPLPSPESVWFDVGEVGFAASGDRLVIEEDQFKSGYECKTCGGHEKVKCPNCNGTGKSQVNAHAKCSVCAGAQAVTCPECNGKGGLLIVAETSQRRPTTGIVRSAGEGCRIYKVGDGVLFSNFAGFAIDLNRAGTTVCLRILHETEVLTKVRGHLELRAISSQREVSSI
jgi:co-chaperonin GroES (HSP10)